MEESDQKHLQKATSCAPAVGLSFVKTDLVNKVRSLQKLEQDNQIIKEGTGDEKNPENKKRKVIKIEISLEEGYGITFSK